MSLSARQIPTAASPTSDREIVLTRVFDFPREVVFEAWTNPAHLPRWWGPKGYTTTTRSSDVRPGGAWRFLMQGPDGTAYDNRIFYVEITPPERIVYSMDSDMEDDPDRFDGEATFEDLGGKTRLTMRMTFSTAAQREAVVSFGAIELGETTLDKLGEFLGRDPEADSRAPGVIELSRTLSAARGLVFEAWSSPAQVTKWWGPHGFSLDECRMDFRPGGPFRFVMRGPDGTAYPFHGAYLEIVPPERIVFSSVIEGPGDRQFTTVQFTDQKEKTEVTVRQTVPDTDFARKGQQQGWTENLERLAAYVEQLHSGS